MSNPSRDVGKAPRRPSLNGFYISVATGFRTLAQVSVGPSTVLWLPLVSPEIWLCAVSVHTLIRYIGPLRFIAGHLGRPGLMVGPYVSGRTECQTVNRTRGLDRLKLDRSTHGERLENCRGPLALEFSCACDLFASVLLAVCVGQCLMSKPQLFKLNNYI